MSGPRKHGTFKGASRARSCESKRAFKSAGAARANMKTMTEKGRVFGLARVYPCRFCGMWHWGHIGGSDRYARVVNAIDRALARDERLRLGREGAAEQ